MKEQATLINLMDNTLVKQMDSVVCGENSGLGNALYVWMYLLNNCYSN